MAEFYLQRSICNKLEDLGIDERIVKLNEFEFGGSRFDFPYFAREIMQRYKHSNPELYKLILKMKIYDDESASLAIEMIMDALNHSVRKLNVDFSYPMVYGQKLLGIPGELFESRALKELSTNHCIITKPTSGSINCTNLVSLNLESVTIGDDMMTDILSSCPLIEYLDIFQCKGFKKISLGKMQSNLKHCLVEPIEGACFVDFFEEGFTPFHNMVSLEFRELYLEKYFFRNSKFKFPCLTDLSLCMIYGLEKTIHIFLPALKYLCIEDVMGSSWVFNVPIIWKFICRGYTDSPPLSISTSSNEWEYTEIELDCLEDPPRSWFLGLREFLQNLRVSKKISLCLKFGYYSEDEPCVDNLTEEGISGFLCIPVENLTFQDLLTCETISLSAFSNLVSGLLFTCRPNFITIEDRILPPPKPSKKYLSFLELLFVFVTEQANWKCDLKQVTFEMLFEEKEWRPIIWDDLIALIRLYPIRLNLERHGMTN